MKLAGLDPVLLALAANPPDASQLKILAESAKSPALPAERRLQCYQAIRRTDAPEVMPLRLDVLAAWSEEKEIPENFTRAIDDFVNETSRGDEIGKLRKLAATGRDSVSRIAWKSLITVMDSPLAKDKWKEQARALVRATPKEVGFFQAIADLKATGFDRQIEEGMNWDNSELIDAAKAAKQAIAASGSAGKKVAELPPAEVTKAAMEGKGDIAAGERLYNRQGCIACHAVDLKAEQKGPYLGAAGAKFTRDYLIDSIIDPNKVVAQGFQTSVLTLKDGSTKMGFITSEADGVVELRDIAGTATKVNRDEVTAETHLPNSMMPPGLAAGLTVEEFISLIEYLVSLRATGG